MAVAIVATITCATLTDRTSVRWPVLVLMSISCIISAVCLLIWSGPIGLKFFAYCKYWRLELAFAEGFDFGSRRSLRSSGYFLCRPGHNFCVSALMFSDESKAFAMHITWHRQDLVLTSSLLLVQMGESNMCRQRPRKSSGPCIHEVRAIPYLSRHFSISLSGCSLFIFSMWNNVVNAWWSIVFYPASDAPKFHNGMIAMIAICVATLLATWLVYYLERREWRNRATTVARSSIDNEGSNGSEKFADKPTGHQ